MREHLPLIKKKLLLSDVFISIPFLKADGVYKGNHYSRPLPQRKFTSSKTRGGALWLMTALFLKTSSKKAVREHLPLIKKKLLLSDVFISIPFLKSYGVSKGNHYSRPLPQRKFTSSKTKGRGLVADDCFISKDLIKESGEGTSTPTKR